MDIYLQEAEKSQDDAKLLLSWCNYPVTFDLTSKKNDKIWKDFWYKYSKEYFGRNCITPMFAISGGKKIAFLSSKKYSVDKKSQDTFDIYINIEPKMREEGHSFPIIDLFCRHIFSNGADRIIAEVKKVDLIAAKAFKKAGFVFFDNTSKDINGYNIEIRRYAKRMEK